MVSLRSWMPRWRRQLRRWLRRIRKSHRSDRGAAGDDGEVRRDRVHRLPADWSCDNRSAALACRKDRRSINGIRGRGDDRHIFIFSAFIETVLNAVQGLILPPESITLRFSVKSGPRDFSTQPLIHSCCDTRWSGSLYDLVNRAARDRALSRRPRAAIQAAIAAAIVWFVTLIPALYQAIQQG